MAGTAIARVVEVVVLQTGDEWVEALPTGNGRLGEIIFGGTSEERIQFNEFTLWVLESHDYEHPGGCSTAIARIGFPRRSWPATHTLISSARIPHSGSRATSAARRASRRCFWRITAGDCTAARIATCLAKRKRVGPLCPGAFKLAERQSEGGQDPRDQRLQLPCPLPGQDLRYRVG